VPIGVRDLFETRISGFGNRSQAASASSARGRLAAADCIAGRGYARVSAPITHVRAPCARELSAEADSSTLKRAPRLSPTAREYKLIQRAARFVPGVTLAQFFRGTLFVARVTQTNSGDGFVRWRNSV
jgi:hypothetical protein